MAETIVKRQKAKSKDFAALGIPEGSILTFRKDPAITCKTVDDKNRVEYLGKVHTLSGLAKELMNTPISGYHAFKYNGVLLAKLETATASTETENPQTTLKPTETTPAAPQTAPSPVPQTVPLPRPQNTPVADHAGNSVKNIDPLAGQPAEDNEEA